MLALLLKSAALWILWGSWSTQRPRDGREYWEHCVRAVSTWGWSILCFCWCWISMRFALLAKLIHNPSGHRDTACALACQSHTPVALLYCHTPVWLHLASKHQVSKRIAKMITVSVTDILFSLPLFGVTYVYLRKVWFYHTYIYV